MSRNSVRLAVADYFDGAGIRNLGTVHRAPPRLTPANEFLADGGDSGAVMQIHLQEQSERRMSMNWQMGWKRRLYLVLIALAFKSVNPDWEAATDDLDTLIEDVTAHIQADPQLGTGGTTQGPQILFQAGEGDDAQGQPDIRVRTDLPRQTGSGNEYWTWAWLELQVVEVMQT